MAEEAHRNENKRIEERKKELAREEVVLVA